MAEREPEIRTEILLNEYSICQSSVESLDASVWQSAGIIGLVTIGTFALIAANNPHLFATIIAGFFSTVGVFVWWRMALRWWSVRDMKIERMRHIEEDLGVHGQSHYIEYMDRLYDGRSAKSVSEDDPLIKKLSRKYGIQVDRARELTKVEYHRKGPKDALNNFRWVTFIVWTFYIAIRSIAWIWKVFGFKVFFLPIWGFWIFDV